MLTPDHDDSSDLIDVDGRPVGELGSSAYASVPTEVGSCPYADARRGRPMNRSALRQLSQVWGDVPVTVSAMAACALRPGTVAGAWQTALAGTALPGEWARTQPGVPVPRRWSAIYKTSLGFSQVLTAMLLSEDGVADCRLEALGTADAFFELLDRERWLVGEEQVCAGPAAWIGRLFEALASPAPAPLPFDVGHLGRRRAVWVALQTAYYGAARQLPGSLPPPRLPCLRAIQALPGRTAVHARRLFAEGDVPKELDAFLKAQEGVDDRGALDDLRGRAVAPFADA
ncbi:MAG: hypothetical protein AAGA48_30260 [Myxococcota bacterium]